MKQLGEIVQGDCLNVLKTLPENSIDLICTDPPFFFTKNEWWDRQWSDSAKFLEWLGTIADEWQRVLKPNGSLYCFASSRMASRVELMLGDRFNVLSNIVWVKPDPNNPLNRGAGRSGQACKESLRQWFPLQERIVFCEHYGADNAAKGEAGYGAKCDELRGFVFDPLRSYLDGERRKANASYRQCNAAIGKPVNGGGMATHYFSDKHYQWALPTPEHYTKLQQAFPGCFTRPYEELRLQYEELRLQYEELRRPFNVSADVPYTDVWTFPTVSAYPGKHPCEKPSSLLEHIITASSKPESIVLDCFAGSGSTLLAAKKLGRQYIGIEIDPHWVAVASQRLGDFSAKSISLEDRLQWIETQVQANAAKLRKIEAQQNGDRVQLSLWG